MSKLSKDPVLGHISTFGGHPLSCAAALAGLEFLLDNHLTEGIHQKEKLFHELLQHPAILELRSSGLLMALELGSFEKVLKSIRFCLNMGLITDWFLHCDTALRIAPPLIISEEEIRHACAIILESLQSLQNEG
jgi:acetylornithine/succinyldiaminopimelate/putrescine aminotransferase